MTDNDESAAAPPPPAKKQRGGEFQLRALGFCGVDDSVHPNLLAILSQAYPFVEFGVLFRPDREGQPRFASLEWVEQLSKVASKSGGTMKLAAHLCGTRVDQVLQGKSEFIQKLQKWGFQRVQINATAVNGVDMALVPGSAPRLWNVMNAFPDMEFILQKNAETKPLWKGLLTLFPQQQQQLVPSNMSMLVDESKGTGVLASSWPAPPAEYKIGYAGGIGPDNIHRVLQEIMAVAGDYAVWIDMESSLRSTNNNKDIFDVTKCYQVIHAVCAAGLYNHPDYLLQ